MYSPSSLTLRAGSEIRETGGQLVGVAKVCDHPKYNPSNNWDYDFSVLKLETPLTLSSTVQTIAIQPEGEEVPTGVLGRVSGWGKLDFTATSLPWHLQTVEVPKSDDVKCAEAYAGYNITSRMTCYAYDEGGKSPCQVNHNLVILLSIHYNNRWQADSGGPVVANGKLTGVVSWSIRCADPKYPAVFCKISNSEIADHIKQCLKDFRSL
ncbi:hypothetical protein ILUMI_08799 [Ignelater luminosus]|uniref:Peptidase S1 domain-containing protein n=1 Tax=Ignelater luminosus TaxID=2038154 RepID=A0A8K0GD25_IGNLU|nr:hypothetical protein ILUMI_08799 [Ignelater luminosus]